MLLIQLGIIFCALSVIIGAFGAHSLESTIADKMDTFKKAIYTDNKQFLEMVCKDLYNEEDIEDFLSKSEKEFFSDYAKSNQEEE